MGSPQERKNNQYNKTTNKTSPEGEYRKKKR